MGEGRKVSIPSLVRIKPGALQRSGIYLRRESFSRVALLSSAGLPVHILERVLSSSRSQGIEIGYTFSISSASWEEAVSLSDRIGSEVDAIVGLGGGKALDVAKYVSLLCDRPFLSIPTSLSNDGFCSPQSSLTIEGIRKSLPSAMPHGVVIDTEIIMQAPRTLWHSGVGDLVSKLTAIRDWKMAFHQVGTPVDDFAALLSDATVYQFMAKPDFDLEGMRRLATALMLNGVAMSVCGSSRPASGSEHLISHALDLTSSRPRLHGLQVGMATYVISQLYEDATQGIADLFDRTGFWRAIESDPFSRREWRVAIEKAPSIKDDFYTILSLGYHVETLMTIIHSDPQLKSCFVD